MTTVNNFYFDCDLIPISARVNLYDANTHKLIVKNYQELVDDNEYDERIVKSFKWNPKTNLLRIWI